jgi:cyclopropane-fatty-acyl-phospholipid synthase
MIALQLLLAGKFVALLRRLVGDTPVVFAVGSTQERGLPHSWPVVRVRDFRTAASLLLDPETAFGEGYSSGSITVEGSLLQALLAFYEVDAFDTSLHKVHDWILRLTQHNSRSGSHDNIHEHYDLSNEFYSWWLDEEMLYTCAYYASDNMTLEQAQQAKMEHVCRKLWLRSGEQVIEAGCGWGSLALYMARSYGVNVRAFNISHEQIMYARERAAREGLTQRVQFIEDDYRNAVGTADVFLSVGMLEHVGRDHYRDLGRVIQRTIGKNGRGLLHFIGRNAPRPLSNWIRKRIFPGAYPPALRESLEVFEPFDYSVLDVENLRPHYASTLIEWLRRYEERYSDVVARFGENFARAWRLYIAGSYVAFEAGSLQLFQITFAGRNCQNAPMTRDHIYSTASVAQRTWKTGT